MNASAPAALPLVNVTTSTPVPISAPTPLPPVNAGMAPPPPMDAAGTAPPPPPPPMVAGAPAPWPPETDLIFAPGTNTVMLTMQSPLLCLVVQDAFENLRAALLVENAFPNACLASTFIQDSLTSGARAHLPGAAEILVRLETDLVYRAKLLPLVSSRAFRLYQAEIVLSHVLGLPSFEVKSRSTVLCLSSRQFRRCILMLLCNSLRSSWRTTLIYTPRDQM